jgi:hypothetical protein
VCRTAAQYMATPVVLVICREITMSALREWAAAAGGSASKVRRGHWEERQPPPLKAAHGRGAP